MKVRRFSQSFRRVFDQLQPGEVCTLQHHYRGVLREVVGMLDKWAAKDPQRFVQLTGGVDALVRYCHRYKQPQNGYGKRAVEYALRELRARHIISGWLLRIRDGEEVSGFIMAPHNCLAVRESETRCVFKGQLRAPGYWKRDVLESSSGEVKLGPVYWAGFAGSLLEELNAYTSRQPATAGPSLDAVAIPQHHAGNAAEQADIRLAEEDCAVDCAVSCAVDCAAKCAVSCAVEESPQPKAGTAVTSESAPIRVSRVIRASESVVESVEKATKPSHGNQGVGSSTDCIFVSSTTDCDQKQTVGQYFAHVGGKPDLDELSDGEYEETELSAQEDAIDLDALLGFCHEVISEWKNRTYLGRKTHGDIMGEAMGRFTKKFRQDVPLYWYPIVKTLRKKPSHGWSGSIHNWREGQPAPKQSSFHIQNDYEFCADNTFRPPADREACGFTVKGADGVWRKANTAVETQR